MTHFHSHESQDALVKRLKRAEGHLRNVIVMVEDHRRCNDLAQQLHAVEKAINSAKKALIHEHLDHCLSEAIESADSQEALAEFREITKYL